MYGRIVPVENGYRVQVTGAWLDHLFKNPMFANMHMSKHNLVELTSTVEICGLLAHTTNDKKVVVITDKYLNPLFLDRKFSCIEDAKSTILIHAAYITKGN